MMKRTTIVLQAFLLAILLSIICPVVAAASEPFEIHVLDVGQGQCVLIEADNHYMLIDGGGRDASSFVVSYLKQLGIGHIDCVALTHYDEDHMAGLIGVLNVFSCGMFLAPNYESNGELYESLAAVALSDGCVIMHGDLGMEIPIGKAIATIIGPVKTDYSSDNDKSICFRISYLEKHFLICGDAERTSELDLVSNDADLSADIYVVDHHGSSSSSMDAFLDAVDPTYAIISCGKNNGYGHPSMETMQRLQNHGISMFRTDQQGTIVGYSDGTDLWFNLDTCTDWTGGNDVIPLEGEVIEQNPDVTRVAKQEEEKQEEVSNYQYVCNTNTKKFHYPDCNSVNQMKEENRLYTNLDRDDLIKEGYEPCGNCKP